MRILYVATVVKNHIMEFHIPYLKMLKSMGWDTFVAAKNDYEDPRECNIPYCDHYYDIPFERSPLKFDNIIAYRMLKRLINKQHFDVIHCHTPMGAMITRVACGKTRKKGTKVIYTAHGFHFYSGAPLINWMVYYPIERILAHRTDVLVTINREDYKRARGFKAGLIKHINGIGIDLNRFKQGSSNDNLRNELDIPSNAKVLLSVGDLNKNKNHTLVIEAMEYFPEVWYVICGRGPLKDDYLELAKQKGVDDRLLLVGYREDVAEFYKIANVFVFPSIREGLPVALMEAMASGLICVASENRGANELLQHSKLKFKHNDVNELVKKLRIALLEDCSNEIESNLENIKKYNVYHSLRTMKKIYQLMENSDLR